MFTPPQPMGNKLGWWWHYNKKFVIGLGSVIVTGIILWKIFTYPFASGTYINPGKEGTYLTLDPDGLCEIASPSTGGTEDVTRGTWSTENGQVVLVFQTIGQTSTKARFILKDKMLVNSHDPNLVWYRK